MPPYGPAPYAPPRQDLTRTLSIVLVVVFFVVFFSIAAFMFAQLSSSGGPVGFFIPLCGIVVFAIVFLVLIIVTMLGRQRQATLPPPPPIQQPMVPAGIQGPVALNCPNCGAPPLNIDRFGVATCNHCGTRYVVR